MSKGSRQRTHNSDSFNTNYDKIFGAKNVRRNDPVPSENEEAVNNECSPIEEKEDDV